MPKEDLHKGIKLNSELEVLRDLHKGIKLNSELEVLREAERSISEGPWVFSDWSTCTCGHVYFAAEGVHNAGHTALIFNHTRYQEIITKVARVLGWDPAETEVAPTDYVSQYTANHSGVGNEVPREVGLQVIREAIEKIEKLEEEARLNVLAEAGKVVDSVDLQEKELVA